jgi:hypothetical protein
VKTKYDPSNVFRVNQNIAAAGRAGFTVLRRRFGRAGAAQ